MRVLVTRPKDAARRTADRLEVLGHKPVLMPLFEAEKLPVSLKADTQYSAFAFTSRNAVDAVVASATIDLWHSIPVFAVGAQTAQAAVDAGFTNVHHAEGGGERLAELVNNSSIADGPLAYFTCEPRSPAFQKRLGEYEIGFDVYICYHMSALAYSQENIDTLLAEKPDVVLLYSQETAKRFFELIEMHDMEALNQTRFLCLSHNVAAAVPSNLTARTFAAETPNEESLFSLL